MYFMKIAYKIGLLLVKKAVAQFVARNYAPNRNIMKDKQYFLNDDLLFLILIKKIIFNLFCKLLVHLVI